MARSSRFSGSRFQSILLARHFGAAYQLLQQEETLDASDCDFDGHGFDERCISACQLDDRAARNGAIEGNSRHEYPGPPQPAAALLRRHGPLGASAIGEKEL